MMDVIQPQDRLRQTPLNFWPSSIPPKEKIIIPLALHYAQLVGMKDYGLCKAIFLQSTIIRRTRNATKQSEQ